MCGDMCGKVDCHRIGDFAAGKEGTTQMSAVHDIHPGSGAVHGVSERR